MGFGPAMVASVVGCDRGPAAYLVLPASSRRSVVSVCKAGPWGCGEGVEVVNSEGQV